ncbi:DNA primase small subunit [Astathelohania contejeani]|uniref:DNA primase small subunit n=1 Tax=Astathelohania contejeani TaxID=164912 RepID=A0ABQ7I0Z1_9MICR|nr:DNA primase small subunit [Thelohania contejeani]
MDDYYFSLLPIYYQKFHPTAQLYHWLEVTESREISFTLQNNVYIRYVTCDTLDIFKEKLIREVPIKIDIGAVYNVRPRHGVELIPRSKELVFDIDLTDYTRDCCDGKTMCNACFIIVKAGICLLNYALREEFGFKKLLFIYSGGRGVHCWVFDDIAKQLSNLDRISIVKYFKTVISKKKYSSEYTNILKNYVSFFDTQKFEVSSNSFTEEDLYNYLFIRLDENVTSEIKHLLKAPFSVHSLTKKISVPLDPERLDGLRIEDIPDLKIVCENPATLSPFISYFENTISYKQ